MKRQEKIVFYDGDCGFCNKSVQFVLKHEKKHEILFSAIQSEFSQQFFINQKETKPDLSTFYFWNGEKLFQKSSAALNLIKELKPVWQVLRIFSIIPKSLRDKMYDFIAKRRHKLNAGFCALPNQEERKRFLR